MCGCYAPVSTIGVTFKLNNIEVPMRAIHQVRVAVLAAGISVAAIAPALANDIFLNIQGVTGPVTNAGFVGDIQLTAYSQGFTDPATLASGTGAGAGKTTTTCGAINITKMVDSTSPDFLQYVTRGVGFKPPRSTSLAPRTVQPLRTCPIPSSSITSASYPLRKATPSATPRVSGSLRTSR